MKRCMAGNSFSFFIRGAILLYLPLNMCHSLSKAKSVHLSNTRLIDRQKGTFVSLLICVCTFVHHWNYDAANEISLSATYCYPTVYLLIDTCFVTAKQKSGKKTKCNKLPEKWDKGTWCCICTAGKGQICEKRTPHVLMPQIPATKGQICATLGQINISPHLSIS